MTKWADYLIHEVRYTSDGSKIKEVKAKKDKGDEVGRTQKMKRMKVVKLLKTKSFMTIYKKDNGKWGKGEEVHKVKVNGKTYIRTDRNEIEEDNLGNLPEY